MRLQVAGITYEIVFCILPKDIMRLDKDGFFKKVARSAGILVKSTNTAGRVWYHFPRDYLGWSNNLLVGNYTEIYRDD